MADPTVAAMEDFDPLDTAARDAQSEADAEKLALAREQANADFLWLMNDQRGRRIVWQLLANAGVFKISFDPTNAMQTSFAEGRRSEGLRLLAQVHSLCPDLYPTMMKENSE